MQFLSLYLTIRIIDQILLYKKFKETPYTSKKIKMKQ